MPAAGSQWSQRQALTALCASDPSQAAVPNALAAQALLLFPSPQATLLASCRHLTKLVTSPALRERPAPSVRQLHSQTFETALTMAPPRSLQLHSLTAETVAAEVPLQLRRMQLPRQTADTTATKVPPRATKLHRRTAEIAAMLVPPSGLQLHSRTAQIPETAEPSMVSRCVVCAAQQPVPQKLVRSLAPVLGSLAAVPRSLALVSWTCRPRLSPEQVEGAFS